MKRRLARNLNNRYIGLKGSAKRRGYAQSLTFDEYVRLVVNAVCHYCGGPLPEMGHGIDRVNCDLGYIAGNCVPCCRRCNNKKGRIESLGFKFPRTVELLRELIVGR